MNVVCVYIGGISWIVNNEGSTSMGTAHSEDLPTTANSERIAVWLSADLYIVLEPEIEC